MRRFTFVWLLTASVVAVAPTSAFARPSQTDTSTARGQVFAPNPVVDLGIQSLTDQKDADYFSGDPVLSKAYHRVTLRNLDGSGALAGDYAKVVSETGKPAAATDGAFIYTRDQDSSSRSWRTTGSRRRSATSSRWASARRCPPSTAASSCCASISSVVTTPSIARAPASSRSPSARAASTTPRTQRSSCTSTATRSRTTRC